jgi:hypothetical protein
MRIGAAIGDQILDIPAAHRADALSGVKRFSFRVIESG